MEIFRYVGVSKVFDKNVGKTVKLTRYRKEASSKWNKTRKLSTENSKLGLPDYNILNKKISNLRIIAEVLWGEGRHLSGRVKITPGKCNLRVTCPNGECCQSLV